MRCRVGLDVRMLQDTGIGAYLRGLLDGFRSAGLEPDLGLALFGREGGPGIPFTAPIYSLGEQCRYPALLRQCRLWHAPHYNVPVLKGRTKLVVTLHDIIHWIFRKQFLTPLQTCYAGFMLKRAVTLADHVIAVSRHTKDDLIAQFGADDKKITVIHQGVDRSCRELCRDELRPAFDALRRKYNVPEVFFLYVGLMKPHKNVLWLLRLFRRLKSEGKVRGALVLIGRKDKRYPPGHEELAALVSGRDIIHLPRVEGDELLVFYNQALALIHPSLYEGFGLTPLEAMACGTPVITTNAASIPEVVGDAALRVATEDEAPMADAILRMESDVALRESYRAKGLERVKCFSWSETARRTAAVYENVLGGGS